MSVTKSKLSINPSNEVIKVGPHTVRFLVTKEDSAGSVAVFELGVPLAQRLETPAHSHDHYEETIYGIEGVLTWTSDVKNNVGGYSIVQAKTAGVATKLFGKMHPHLQMPEGWIEVIEIMAMPGM